MIDIKFIRENPDKVKQGCEKKQVKCDIDRVLELDEKRRSLLQEIEKLKAEQNKLSKGKSDKEQIQKAKEIKQKIKKIDPELDKVKGEFDKLMGQVPNLPFDEVLVGKDEEDLNGKSSEKDKG